MEVKLYFSEEGMTQFLLKRGYTIDTIQSWKIETEYHNQVTTVKMEVTIAFKKEQPKELLESHYYSIKSAIGLEKVFQDEFYKALLSI
jgi:hypothetical protein